MIATFLSAIPERVQGALRYDLPKPETPVLDSGDEKVSWAEKGARLSIWDLSDMGHMSLTLLQVSLNQHNVYLRLL